jgi:hypothetical protein
MMGGGGRGRGRRRWRRARPAVEAAEGTTGKPCGQRGGEAAWRGWARGGVGRARGGACRQFRNGAGKEKLGRKDLRYESGSAPRSMAPTPRHVVVHVSQGGAV